MFPDCITANQRKPNALISEIYPYHTLFIMDTNHCCTVMYMYYTPEARVTRSALVLSIRHNLFYVLEKKDKTQLDGSLTNATRQSSIMGHLTKTN